MPRKNTNSFINEATLIHSNKYDYSKVVYINRRTKVVITCREHGPFLQLPYNHLKGSGCPLCSIKNKERKINTNGTITCKMCGIDKLTTEFFKNDAYKMGFNSTCKTCFKTPERIKYAKNMRILHRDKINENMRYNYHKNRSRRIKKHKLWMKANRQKQLDYYRDRWNNMDFVKKQKLLSIKRKDNLPTSRILGG